MRHVQLCLLAPLLRRAQALVAIADFEIRDYGAIIGVSASRFVKIPNGADLPADVPMVPADGKLIVSVGRLEPYKGHRRVLAAFPDVLAHEPAARLWIAGAGPDEMYLRDLANELDIAEKVEIGATDRASMAGRLKGAALLVLLSEFESHPLAVLEAASLGIPALVADNSGMAELAEQKFACAVALDSSPEAHATAMLETMAAPRPPARHDIPTWDDCARDLAALYRTVAIR
jgi:glycosyltransferase involved in cell wall biosynthesis